LPEKGLKYRIVHRVAGLGSLGRERFVAVAEYRGAKIAREAKALAPSGCVWAAKGKVSERILYEEIVDRSVRAVDPFVHLNGRWIVRRLGSGLLPCGTFIHAKTARRNQTAAYDGIRNGQRTPWHCARRESDPP